ncbi:uncharacterized protein EDB93DRAFT_515199 [Suillus bovinus]|uniref:uncharacterized protein n=1 Tax=Suillus bovinus TaxID=48563 RepID=UPI001B8720E6|nr:uncharacterized protein EDB93DRAFT_515199 [Suillus bovinus]KAG2145326.1 hypothetical protein EDB93DRAFT_515199 [Suillus bovinus]
MLARPSLFYEVYEALGQLYPFPRRWARIPDISCMVNCFFFKTFAAGASIWGVLEPWSLAQATLTRDFLHSRRCAATVLISFYADKVTSGLVFIVFVLGQGSLALQGWQLAYIIATLICRRLLCALLHRMEAFHGENYGARLFGKSTF